MTTLGVMSDTHGCEELMLCAARIMTEHYQANRIFHLGDDYADGLVLQELGFRVLVVPGLWCAEYQHPHIPHRVVEDIEGLTVVAVHAEKDLRPQDWDADVILTGHTHRAMLQRIGKAVHLNPGHLSYRNARSVPQSFGIVRISGDQLYAALCDLKGEVTRELTLHRIRYA